MATSSDATSAAAAQRTSADAHAAASTPADSDTDPYAYTYADRPGEYYAPYTVLFANTADDLVPEHWVARYGAKGRSPPGAAASWVCWSEHEPSNGERRSVRDAGKG